MMRPYEHTHRFLTRKRKNSKFEKVPSKHAEQCEHTRQELMRAQSVRVRNCCVHCAYASGTDACTDRARHELMRALSVRVRN
jgi:hypothetical protein